MAAAAGRPADFRPMRLFISFEPRAAARRFIPHRFFSRHTMLSDIYVRAGPTERSKPRRGGP